MNYNIETWKKHLVPLDTGINMAYYETGPAQGTPLLLIHGVTDGHVSWMQMAPMLARAGCRCIIVEYRGNGATDKPDCGESGYTAEMIAEDILNLMNKIGLERCHAVGHSFGSLICQELSIKDPSRFRSYTLIDTTSDCRNNPVFRMLLNGDGHGFRGIYGYSDHLPEDFLLDWTQMSNEDEAFRQATLDNVKNMPMLAWQNLIRGLAKFHNDRLGSMPEPVQVIWGTEDDIFPMKDQELVRKKLSRCNATFIPMEGASHNGFWDSLRSCRAYAEQILRFTQGERYFTGKS